VRRRCRAEHDREVSHTVITDPASEVAIQAGAVVSKGVHRSDVLHMAPQAPHALVATEPTVMLLTLIGP
jgi:hypothetical protein